MGNIGGIQNQQEGGRGKGQKTTNALAPVRNGKTDWGVRVEKLFFLFCVCVVVVYGMVQLFFF